MKNINDIMTSTVNATITKPLTSQIDIALNVKVSCKFNNDPPIPSQLKRQLKTMVEDLYKPI